MRGSPDLDSSVQICHPLSLLGFCRSFLSVCAHSMFGSKQKGPAEQVAPRVSFPQNLQILSVRFPYNSLEKI